jgi:DNA polymerase elongation subunit (family B)
VKVVANTLYGLCGSRASPLFWRPVATAITAYGRKAIKTAIDVMNSRGHTFLCADTDSAISTMASRITMYTTLKCECVPVDPIV